MSVAVGVPVLHSTIIFSQVILSKIPARIVAMIATLRERFNLVSL